MSVTAGYENGAGILVKPLLTDGLSAQQYHGSEDPIQGWVSYDYAVKVPAPALQYSMQSRAGRDSGHAAGALQGRGSAM